MDLRMKRQTRGKQRALAMMVDGFGSDSNRAVQVPLPKERKVFHLYVPHAYVRSDAVDVQGFVADVNRKISERGFITYDGQILRTPVTGITVASGFIPIERNLILTGHARVGDKAEIVLEDGDYEAPPQRSWDTCMSALFDLTRPYQMGEEPGSYSASSLSTVVSEPYLLPGELIVAVVHGIADDYYFYCECHGADIVYTSRHRLVCMGCGGMHLALRTPLTFTAKRLFTAADWFQHFDDDGELRCEEVNLSTIDFQEFENAETIWTTDRWEAASHRFIFFLGRHRR
jgi:hypothetical protein